jgi:hypothetical protein
MCAAARGQFLVGYGQVMSTFPSTKPAVAQFLARCHVRLRADLQERVLRSCAGLFQQLLADGDWTVCAETMQSFQHFAQFIPYPLDSIQVRRNTRAFLPRLPCPAADTTHAQHTTHDTRYDTQHRGFCRPSAGRC